MEKITRFSLQPPEFINFFDNVGEYYRWFYISKKKTRARDILQYLSVFLNFSCWFYGQQRKIRVGKKAFPEIIERCENDILYEQNKINDDDPKMIIKNIFIRINRIIQYE